MRLPDLDLATLTPRQTELYERIGGKRGQVRGPFLIWLRSPELCDKVEALGAFLRFDSVLPERIRELSILVTARFFDAQYSWAAHSEKAVKAGMSEASVEQLARGEVPEFAHPDEKAFYDFAMELLTTHFVSDATYQAAREAFGEQGLVDVIGAMGNFSMLAMCLNAFQVELRPEQKAPFADIQNFRKIR